MGSPIDISQMTSSLVDVPALLADPPRTVHPSATSSTTSPVDMPAFLPGSPRTVDPSAAISAAAPESDCLISEDYDFDNGDTACANTRYNRNYLADPDDHWEEAPDYFWEVEDDGNGFENAEAVRVNTLLNEVLESPDEDQPPSGDRSTVEDSDEAETPARLPSPFVDIRYNPGKKSWADLDDEDDEAWAGINATTPLDFLRHNTGKTLADLDENHGGSCAAAVVTPKEKPAPRIAEFEDRGYCPRTQSWVVPDLDIIWEEQDEGPVDVRCFPAKSRWVFNRTSRARITGQ